MIINAYNSGADSYMTDFEDSNSPNWFNQIQGQVNLKDAIRRKLSFVNEVGKEYKLNDQYRHLANSAARLASGRETCAGRWPARFRRYFRFWPGVLPQRQGTDRPWRRSVLLSAEDGEPSGSAAVERHFLHGAG
jgi:malate synthase